MTRAAVRPSWSDTQKANLRRIYAAHPAPTPLPPAAELEAVLGHSISSIRTMAQRLGVTSGPRGWPTEELTAGREASANLHSRTRSGRRADLGGLFVRSGWEANYARYLNWLVEKRVLASWEYEPMVFEFPVKRGNRSYTPDFRVTVTDGSIEWHEVKGWMDDSSRVKLDRFARYYPDEKLLLIDGPVYRELAKSVAGLIAHWE